MAEPDRILRIRTVLQRTGLSRSTLYRKINDGTFPRQVQISVHGAGWRESAINHWVADPVGWQVGEGAAEPQPRPASSASGGFGL
jgi:prophage regulatory protein